MKSLSLLNEANHSKFMTIKWNIVNDLSNANHDVGNKIIYNTEILQSNLCDYNDTHIVVADDINVLAAPAMYVSFKNCASFTKCTKKINKTGIDDAKDLDLVLPMCNLIEYISKYSKATGSLRLYSKDEGTDFNGDIANDNNIKSFKYKAKLLGNTEAQLNPNNTIEF